MKRFLNSAALALAFASPVFATDVGVSVSIGQPGFYGRLDIGGYPPPQFIYAEPVFIGPAPMNRPPIYLRVPPGHAKHWSKHCSRYNACGERVYFVKDDWYTREYAPRYQERHREHWENERHEYKGDYRGNDGNGGRGNDHQKTKGHGNGHGNKK
jgi:hypothetical protein